MSKDFLSQDEVDALLRGVGGEQEEAPAEVDPSGVRAYDLATQERIVRGRMPTLEMINERFARSLKAGFHSLTRRTAEIAMGPVRVQKYSEFVRNLAVPTNLNLVQVKPLRGTALFVFDPSLVFLVVDNMFGGDGRFHSRIEGRDFTPTEQRIVRRMLGVVFEEYEKAWKPVYPLTFEHLRSEMNTQFAAIATPNEVVVTTTFTVELGPIGGDVHLCTPYSMLEPIRDLLCSTVQGDQTQADNRWVELLSSQIQLAEVELVTNLGQVPLKVQEILDMQVGDVIPLELPETVTAEVDGIPVLECRYGVCNGRYALRVNRLVPSPSSQAGADSALIR